MKSSSELFPVSLYRAEIYDDISEDVYMVKHNRDQDRTVQVAVYHLGLVDKKPTKGPVVLVHGSFSNHGFWLSEAGIGLARFLLEQGFDVWLQEHRGHGLSPRNRDYKNNTVERYVLHDVSAVNEFVAEKTGAKPLWVGHSMGGVMIASAVAAGIFTSANCRGFVLLGSQVLSRHWYSWFPFGTTIMRGWYRLTRDEFDGRKMRIGPENEPVAYINEYLARHSWFGSWQLKSQKKKLLPEWKKGSDIPMLAMIAAADKSEPLRACKKFAALYGGANKEQIVLGKADGFKRNYGHVNMIISKDAAEEVWPRIADWLAKQA